MEQIFKTNIEMPAPCVGTLQKTHIRSQFVRFHLDSQMAKWAFSETPRIVESKDKKNEIVVLQVMCFGDNEMLIEYVSKKCWDAYCEDEEDWW